jgi:hypothetical protein
MNRRPNKFKAMSKKESAANKRKRAITLARLDDFLALHGHSNSLQETRDFFGTLTTLAIENDSASIFLDNLIKLLVWHGQHGDTADAAPQTVFDWIAAKLPSAGAIATTRTRMITGNPRQLIPISKADELDSFLGNNEWWAAFRAELLNHWLNDRRDEDVAQDGVKATIQGMQTCITKPNADGTARIIGVPLNLAREAATCGIIKSLKQRRKHERRRIGECSGRPADPFGGVRAV